MEPETTSYLVGEGETHYSFAHEAGMKKVKWNSKIKILCVCVNLPYMDEVFISATDDVVVGDGDGVDAPPTGLQDMNTLQRPDVPNLTDRERERGSQRGLLGKKKKHLKKEGEDDEYFFGRDTDTQQWKK